MFLAVYFLILYLKNSGQLHFSGYMVKQLVENQMFFMTSAVIKEFKEFKQEPHVLFIWFKLMIN